MKPKLPRAKNQPVPLIGNPILSAGNPKPKAVKAAPEVVEARLAMECDRRTPDGKCPSCKTCGGAPSCRQIAEWKHCPNKLW